MTDGLDSMKPTQVEINLSDIKQLKKEQVSDDEIETESSLHPNEDFIPLTNTKSLRSLLRRRNQMSSSDDEDLLMQTQHEPNSTNNEADVLSASSSDEEARWERHLVERGVSGPAPHHSVIASITHGKNALFYLISSRTGG